MMSDGILQDFITFRAVLLFLLCKIQLFHGPGTTIVRPVVD